MVAGFVVPGRDGERLAKPVQLGVEGDHVECGVAFVDVGAGERVGDGQA